MKKLILSILFILCLSFQASAFNPMIVVSGGGAASCVKDTTDPVMDYLGGEADGGMNLTSNAVGQSISYGNAWQLHTISVKIDQATNADCRFSVRIGPDADLTTTYYEEWTDINPGEGESIKAIESVDFDSYEASTTYYIGFIETAGICSIRRDATSPTYAGGSYIIAGSVWNMSGGADTGRDYIIEVDHTTVTPCE